VKNVARMMRVKFGENLGRELLSFVFNCMFAEPFICYVEYALASFPTTGGHPRCTFSRTAHAPQEPFHLLNCDSCAITSIIFFAKTNNALLAKQINSMMCAISSPRSGECVLKSNYKSLSRSYRIICLF